MPPEPSPGGVAVPRARDAAAALVPLVLAALLFGAACLLGGCTRSDPWPRRVVTWPPIYGCVAPHGETCATPAPKTP